MPDYPPVLKLAKGSRITGKTSFKQFIFQRRIRFTKGMPGMQSDFEWCLDVYHLAPSHIVPVMDVVSSDFCSSRMFIPPKQWGTKSLSMESTSGLLKTLFVSFCVPSRNSTKLLNMVIYSGFSHKIIKTNVSFFDIGLPEGNDVSEFETTNPNALLHGSHHGGYPP